MPGMTREFNGACVSRVLLRALGLVAGPHASARCARGCDWITSWARAVSNYN